MMKDCGERKILFQPPVDGRPTWAEVNLDALVDNYQRLSSLLQGASADRPRIIPVIKADAYGHGMIPVAQALAGAGATLFAVGIVEEGLELRRAGISQDILVMGTTWWGLEKEALRNRLILSVDSPESLRRLESAAEETGSAASIHIKVDTGMGRLGVRWDAMEPLLEAVRGAGRVRLQGVFSHLSSADDRDPLYTLVQRRRFERALDTFQKAGLQPGDIHFANSAGLLHHKSLRRWSARCGLGIYGYAPDPRRSPLELRPVLSLKTRIGFVRALRRGEPTGYGRLFSASRSSRIGILPIGYADGLSRRFSNRGKVIIGDRWAKIAGAVSMDMTAVDITDLPDAREGDEVILLGSSGRCRMTAREWSDTLRTVPYEVLCGIAERVPRVCVRNH